MSGAASGRSIAIVGCGGGRIAIAMAIRHPHDVVAAFDPDPRAVARARRHAAIAAVADRVTFEAAPPGAVRGSGYHLVVLVRPGGRGLVPFTSATAALLTARISCGSTGDSGACHQQQ